MNLIIEPLPELQFGNFDELGFSLGLNYHPNF